MEYREWEDLEREEREEILEQEKEYQLEPELVYLGIRRPRPQAEQVLDEIL
jgi:hypothetical protein